MGSLPVTPHGHFRCLPRVLATNETCRNICHLQKSTEHTWWWELCLITFLDCLCYILVLFPTPSWHFFLFPLFAYQFQGIWHKLCWNVVDFTGWLTQVLCERNIREIFVACDTTPRSVVVAVWPWEDKKRVGGGEIKGLWRSNKWHHSRLRQRAITRRPSPHKITLRTCICAAPLDALRLL